METFYQIGCVLAFCLGLSRRALHFIKFAGTPDGYIKVGNMLHPFNGMIINYYKRTWITYLMNFLGSIFFLIVTTGLSWLTIVGYIIFKLDEVTSRTDAEKTYKSRLQSIQVKQKDIVIAKLRVFNEIVTEEMVAKEIESINERLKISGFDIDEFGPYK